MADNEVFQEDKPNIQIPSPLLANPFQYDEAIAESSFRGEYPYDTIMEGLKNQFDDYINIEDDTDYIEIFYNQLHESIDQAKADNESHPREKLDILNIVYTDFIDAISTLFYERLNITIVMIDNGNIYDSSLEDLMSRLYHFFIMDARKNFTQFLINKTYPKVKNVKSDEEFSNIISETLQSYDPLIMDTNISTFLGMLDADDINEWYEEGLVAGNFMLKYSPKLYMNTSLGVDVTFELTMRRAFMSDISKEDK